MVFHVLLLCAVAVFSFAYIHWRIGAPLVYHQANRLPSLVGVKWKAAEEFLSYPGGPVDGLAELLSDRYFLAMPGTIILVSLIVLVTASTMLLSAAMGLRRSAGRLLIPAVVVLALLNQYVDPTTLVLSVATVFLGAAAWQRLPIQRSLWRVVAFLPASALVYFLVGEYYFLFALICGLSEWQRRRGTLVVLALVLAVALPYVGGTFLFPDARYLYDMTDSLAARLLPMFYNPWTGFVPVLAEWQPGNHSGFNSSFLAQYYLPVPGAAIAMTVFALLLVSTWLWRSRTTRSKRPPKDSAKVQTSQSPFMARARVALPGIVFVLVLVLIPFVHFSEYRRSTLRLDYYAENRMWKEVLAEVPNCYGAYDTVIGAAVNRALYHLGLLSDVMFRYPQEIETLAMTRYLTEGKDPYDVAQLYFEIGRVNEAERFCHESIESYGERPCVLYLAARINVVKRRPEAAKAFLRVLRRYGKYREDADSLLARLEADPLLESDPKVVRLRELMLKEDFTIGNQTLYVDERWLTALEADRTNHEAFEYLMAFLLVSRRLDIFVEQLARLDDFSYTRLPKHWEEGILLYRAVSRKQVPLGKYRVSEVTSREVSRFVSAYNAVKEAYPHDVGAQARALAGEHRFSYGYYFLFGPNGLAYEKQETP